MQRKKDENPVNAYPEGTIGVSPICEKGLGEGRGGARTLFHSESSLFTRELIADTSARIEINTSVVREEGSVLTVYRHTREHSLRIPLTPSTM